MSTYSHLIENKVTITSGAGWGHNSVLVMDADITGILFKKKGGKEVFFPWHYVNFIDIVEVLDAKKFKEELKKLGG